MIYIYYILHIIYIYLSPYPTFGDTRARARGVTLGGGGFLSKLPQAPIYIYGAIIYIYIMRIVVDQLDFWMLTVRSLLTLLMDNQPLILLRKQLSCYILQLKFMVVLFSLIDLDLPSNDILLNEKISLILLNTKHPARSAKKKLPEAPTSFNSKLL